MDKKAFQWTVKNVQALTLHASNQTSVDTQNGCEVDSVGPLKYFQVRTRHQFVIVR